MSNVVELEGRIAWLRPFAAREWAEVDSALLTLAEMHQQADVRVVLVEPGDVGHLRPLTVDLYGLERLRLPTVTWLAGPVTDAAAAIALCCDIRVAGDDATLQIASGMVASRVRRRLTSLLFDTEYAARLLKGAATDAGELLETGLAVSRVADPAAGARAIAATIAERAPIATQLAKEAIWRGLVLPLEQGLRTETDLTMLLISTNDRAEGVAAFVEKRPPQFTGE